MQQQRIARPALLAALVTASVLFGTTAHDSCGCATPSYGDTTPPTVAMSAPANNATVSGASVTVSATASDDVGVAGVQFQLDGANLGAEDTTNPYSIVWDSTATTDAAHSLSAVARDAAGHTTTSTITVTVSNGGGGTPLANLWVDSNGGTCTYSAVLIAYVDATACSSANAAYHVAHNGTADTVDFACGSYAGGQAFVVDATKTTAINTVFQPATPYCATVSGPVNTIHAAAFNIGSADYITIQNFVLYGTSFTSNPQPNGSYAAAILSNANVTNDASVGVSILNNHINVGAKIDGCCSILINAVTDWVIRGNTIGPSCCGEKIPGSPEGIRASKGSASAFAASCFNQPCNLTIDNNTIQYVSRDPALWPSSGGWGSAPDTICSNAQGCHMDAIHIYGCSTCAITNNKIYGVECQGIFFEQTSASVNSNIDIIGNAISPLPGGCSGKGIDITFAGTSVGFSGTFNVKFNSAVGSNLILAVDCGSAAQAGTVVNVIGNVGAFLDSNCSGNQATCAVAAGMTVNWRYNVWSTSNACDATDTANVSTSVVASPTAPVWPTDLHLTGGAQTADNYVPTSVLGGCPPTDMDGTARPIGVNCDAGADER